jgi:hypothetical protein
MQVPSARIQREQARRTESPSPLFLLVMLDQASNKRRRSLLGGRPKRDDRHADQRINEQNRKHFADNSPRCDIVRLEATKLFVSEEWFWSFCWRGSFGSNFRHQKTSFDTLTGERIVNSDDAQLWTMNSESEARFCSKRRFLSSLPAASCRKPLGNGSLPLKNKVGPVPTGRVGMVNDEPNGLGGNSTLFGTNHAPAKRGMKVPSPR